VHVTRRITANRHPATKEQIKAMGDDYQGGMTLKQLGDKYGLTYHMTRQLLIRNGYNLRTPGGGNKRQCTKSKKDSC